MGDTSATLSTSLVDLRRPPRLNKATLMALGPTCLQVLEQASQALSDRMGWPGGPDTPPSDGLLAPSAYAAQRALDFSDRLDDLDSEVLEIVEAELQGVYWAFLGLHNIQTHFPQVYQQLTLDMFQGWWDILWAFYHLVNEQGWFPLNWQLLQHLWDGWRNASSDPKYLVHYLVKIPLQVFGVGPFELEEVAILALLHGLLLNPHLLRAEELSDLGFNIAPDDIRSGTLYRRVREAELSHLKPPLCYLGEVALVVAGETENPFLDVYFDYHTLSTSQPFFWDRDVEALREAWTLAEPVASKVTAFLSWFHDDEAGKIRETIGLILELGGFSISNEVTVEQHPLEHGDSRRIHGDSRSF
jgi:hypothetical protein